MPRTNFDQLLDAGVHFGHLKRKWNPYMAPYIFMERNGIHIIDLHKTIVKLDEAANALQQIAKSGRKILFVATKKQAKDIVSDAVTKINMPYVTERWPGGMLTNFPTIRKAVKKMSTIDKMATDGTFENMSKRERLQVTRQRAKLEKNLGSIVDLTRLPAAMFVVDISKEHIAVREAKRLNIPVFAMVDTNSNPNEVEFAIPANDDASKSISLVIDVVCGAIQKGLSERKMEREKESSEKESSEKKSVKKESAKKDPEVKESAKKEPVAKEESVSKETAKKEPEVKEAAKKEPEVKETPKKETVKKEAAVKETVKKETSKKEVSDSKKVETKESAKVVEEAPADKKEDKKSE